MEDISLLAITAPPDWPGMLQENVAAIARGCEDMRSLIAAAEVLARNS